MTSEPITLRRTPTRLNPDPETVVGILVSAPTPRFRYWTVRPDGHPDAINRILDARLWEKR